MRVFLVDADRSEITDIVFSDVRNKMQTGGSCAFQVHDPQMARIGTMKKALSQRIEIRKNDGSTVLWEGVLTNIFFSDKINHWICKGMEGLRVLDGVNCGYNPDKGAGVVTAIDDDDTPPKITDKNQTFAATLVGCEVLFTDTVQATIETVVPDNNSDFFNGGVAADTETGTFADLAVGGVSNAMYLTDTNERGLDYYGIELVFPVTQHATAQQIIIDIDAAFEPRNSYLENGTQSPSFNLYDDDGAAWQTTDGNGVTGLGRSATGFGTWGGTSNDHWIRRITIDNTDIGGYMDGAGNLKIRVTCGLGGDAVDTVKMYFAKLYNTYSTVYAAETGIYTIDVVNGSDLTFTGQTPYADQIRAGDTFRIGQDINTIIDNFWLRINWIDIEDAATTIVDCTDLRASKVGPTLRRYGDILNWDLWQEVGWNVRFGGTADATGLSLTHANFKDFTFGIDSKETAKLAALFASDFWTDINSGDTTGSRLFADAIHASSLIVSQAAITQASSGYIGSKGDIIYNFRGMLDHDAGTDYSAVGLGKKITITLYTDKVVLTNAIIDELGWFQNHGEHLRSEVVIKI